MGKRLLPTFATMMLLAGAAGAVDLREAALQSGSGQALDAVIRLDDTEGLRTDQIEIRVADIDDFARFSLEREPILDSLELTIDLESAEGPVLRLTSPVVIDQPFLSLLLDTRWPSGRVLTEYTLRLQTAAFSAQEAPTRIEPTRSEPAPLAPAPDSSTDSSATVNAPQTIDSSQATDSSQTADTSQATDTAQTINTSGPAAPAPTTASAAPNQAATAAAGQATSNLDNASTITVGQGDTLWAIALRVRPDSSVSVQQTMLALQRLNPQAFIGNNINQVMRGAVLRVPELADIRQLDNAQAVAEVARQNQLLTGAAVPQTTAGATTNSASPQGELRIVAVEDNEAQQPDASAAGSQAAERERRLNELEDRLAVRQEELDRLERANEELDARLAMLQEQVTASQEIIRLRDLELAQLQQSLAEQANERPTPPPPPVVTMAPEGSPMERIANTLINNTWALAGIILALIVLVVLVLAARNRAARANEQQARQTTDDPDELLFADVANASAQRGSAAAAVPDPEAAEDVESPDEPESTWEDEGGQPDPQELEEAAEDSAAPALATAATAATATAAPGFYDDYTDPEDLELDAELATDDNLDPDDDFDFDYQPDSLAGTESAPEPGSLSDSQTGSEPARAPEAESAATTEELIEALDAASTPQKPLDPDQEFSLDTAFELDESITTDSGEPREQGHDGALDADLEWTSEESEELEAAGISVPPALDPTSSSRTRGNKAADDNDFDDLAFVQLEDLLGEDDDDEAEGDGFGYGLGSDEVATKLDLARAYIDMGDEPGAREILEEVLQEGTDEQRGEANKLIERL